MEDSFPIEFQECEKCGETKTVAQLACAGDPNVAEGVFISMGKEIVPVGDMSKVAGLTVRAVVLDWDICAACGTKRYTRAEIQQIPIRMQMGGQGGQARGGKPPFFGKG